MFERSYHIRYSDLDKNSNLRISAVLDILQDISIAHSTSVGLSLKNMYQKNVAWLLQGWRVEFLEDFDESKLDVRTGIMNVRMFESSRKYEIYQNGVLKAKATGSWFTVDTDKMKVILVPEEIYGAYDTITEENNCLPFLKQRPVKEIEQISETKVERRDLDTNNHMNNVKSVEVALEVLPENMKVKELNITYRKALLPENSIKICGQKKEKGYYVELKNEAGQTCVLLYAEEK